MRPKLIALDIDGTVLTESGELLPAVFDSVARVVAHGHEVMLATGRSVAMTLPVLERLNIVPEYVVCSNGAITLQRDTTAPTGYRQAFVESFDPTEVLTTIRQHLPEANYAVEDESGLYRYHGYFPDGALGAISQKVEFEALLDGLATRVVVIAPDQDQEHFLSLVENMGLHKVSYNIGWTSWLDIAPDGVNKSTALERVRGLLGVAPEDLIAIGDGRNDVEMLLWAGASGRGVAMAQAPEEVLAIASEVTASDLDAGVARVLESIVR